MKFKSDIEVQAGLKDSSGSAGTSGKILSSTGTGVAWVDDNPGISGSGTTNYISKFTGTTTLGNSQLFDNGTNVGIGTTSPIGKLDVVGTATGATLLGGRFSNITANATGVKTRIELPVFNGAAGGVIEEIGNSIDGYRLNIYQSQSSGVLTFGTAGDNERMRITSTGNVGIGTSSPGYKLSINGDASIVNNSSLLLLDTAGNPGFQIRNTSSNVALIHQGNNGTLRYRAGFSSNSANAHIFAVGADTEIVRFTNDGNVGIGTSTPSIKLQVETSVNNSDGIWARNTNTGTSAFGSINCVSGVGAINLRAHSAAHSVWPSTSMLNSASAFTGGMVLFQDGANPISLWTNGSERMRVTSAGNVGIGTTSPISKFQSTGTISIGSGSASTSGTMQLLTGGASPISNRITYGTDGSGWKFAIGKNQGGTVTDQLVIQDNGNIGIGTTSPSERLHVSGNGLITGTLEVDTVNNGVGNFLTRTAGGIITMRTAAEVLSDIGASPSSGSANYIQNQTAANQSASFRISGTGNLLSLQTTNYNSTTSFGAFVSQNGGFAVSLPTTYTGGWARGLEFTTAGTSTIQAALGLYGSNTTSERMYMSFGTAPWSSTGLYLTSANNVGIGTSSPTVKLHLLSSSENEVRVQESTNNAFISLYQQSTTSYLIAGRTGSTPTQDLSIYTGGGEKIRILANGNVGIGTSTPQRKLDVISGANNFVSVGISQMSVGQWAGIGFGYAEGSNNLYRKSAIVFERTDLTSNNAQGKVHILNGPQGNANSATLSDSKLTIAENGNVGIGTTSPGAKLDVNGDALINQLTIGQGPVVGQGNTALGKGALGSMVGGKANIAVGSNANSDNDVTGLTVIGVDLNVNPAGSALTQNSLVIGQYNALNYSTQYPHIYAPDKVNCPNGNTTTDVIAVDYSIYTAIFMEYSIFNSAGDQFRAGTYTAAFKGTGTVIEDDNQTVVYSGTTLAATFTTSVTGNVVTIQLRNQDSDTYDIRVTARLLMR